MTTEIAPPCARCGGPHPFDTSVPSVVWNAVIRKAGLPEYLCATCILRSFAMSNVSFTATLWGDRLDGVPIEVRILGAVALDAAAVSAENTALRVQVRELTEACKRLLTFNEELAIDVGVSGHYPSAEFARAAIAKAEGSA